ncbi:RING finger protein 151-like [Branchiostoma floridae]|uniref:RING finger protein 151-like n=1 Tax=Branchiostoma floridae TaxID=7739 RepID=A0A9J7LI50_BRAFL|nr:RING finger protein 151-like [Branchiostoma floridae]
MEDPWQCPCGHVFCKVCIQHWLQSHMFSNCPVCRVPCFKFQLRPVVHMVRNLINCLTVRCENSEAGCDKKVELQKYDSHKKVCEFATVPCPNEGCELHILRKDVEEHDHVCDYHQLMCPDGCGDSILRKELDSHSCIMEERVPGRKNWILNKSWKDLRNTSRNLRKTPGLLRKLPFIKIVREICLKVCAGKNLKWRVCAVMALEELAEEFVLNVQDDFKTVCQKAGVRPQRIQVIMDKVLDDFESDLL